LVYIILESCIPLDDKALLWFKENVKLIFSIFSNRLRSRQTGITNRNIKGS